MKISSYSVRHPVIIGMVLIALALFGIYAISTTNVEFMGTIEMPQVYVLSVWPGASSEDIEKQVVNVLEENFVTLPDFRSVSSTCSNSYGTTVITFADGVNAWDKINDVRNNISELENSLPDGLSGLPRCLIGGASMLPVVSFATYGGEDLASVSEFVEKKLLPKLTRIDGVSTVEIEGTVEPEVSIRLRVEEMNARKISPLAVYQVLNYSNNSIPLGTSTYEDKLVTVRYDGAFSSLDEIRNLPVGATDDNQIIRLGEVADIKLDYQNRDTFITKNGEDVIVVSLCKRSDGNTVKIVNQVEKILAETERETGGALRFEMIQEDKTTVTNSMRTVIESGVTGIIIAILIIFLFLNDSKATFVIGLSIPLSIFFTFLGMKVMNITVNLLSISGIVVALGSIVDASIVVLEETYRFYQTMDGEKARYSVTKAIDLGSDKVGMSVIGSNMTTVVVFLPIAMLSGLVGMLIRDVSITFMISILASLIVAIVFVPWLMKKFLKEADEVRVPKKKSLVVKGVERFEKVYGKAIASLLKDPFFMILMAIGILLITGYTLPKQNMTFIPSTDNGDFYVNVTFPYGYSTEETRKGMMKVEDIVLNYMPEGTVRTYLTYSGGSAGGAFSSSSSYKGGMHLVLVPVAERSYDIHEAITSIQYLVEESIPDVKVEVSNGGFDRLVGFVSDGGGFGINLIGDDEKLLYEEAARIRDYLLTDPEVMSASVNATYDNMSAVMNTSYDNLSSLGITSYEAGMTNAILFNGLEVGKFADSDTSARYSIKLTSDITDYPVNESIMNMIQLSGAAGSVSMGAVSDLKVEAKLSQINHSDRAKSMSVNAKITGESTTGIQSRLNEWMEENPLPEGIDVAQGGLGQLVADAVGPLLSSLGIAVFLVYFVMVVVFERFQQPIQIMMTLPFCLIGVTLSLTIFSSSLSLVSILGVISLMGMLVNNGIILVDSINQLNREKREELLVEKGVWSKDMTESETMGHLTLDTEVNMLFDNVVNGTTSRLRPILMSSLTTILGVVPMAAAIGEGAEIYAPLGQVIMGGLLTSMVITLFITPVIYYLFERRKIRKIYKRIVAVTEEN